MQDADAFDHVQHYCEEQNSTDHHQRQWPIRQEEGGIDIDHWQMQNILEKWDGECTQRNAKKGCNEGEVNQAKGELQQGVAQSQPDILVFEQQFKLFGPL